MFFCFQNIFRSFLFSLISGIKFSDVYVFSDYDECSSNNGNCSHICLNDHGSYQCLCNHGYHILDDNRTCSGQDIIYLILLSIK